MSKNILLVYYSHSANTRKFAELIREKTDGTLCELVPKKVYPRDYNTVVEQAKKEIQTGFRPELKTEIKDIASYDTVFVGTPNWWSTIAPPVVTFLASNDLAGKIIAPFCTHGGGGSGHIEATIKKLCPASTVRPLLSVYGGTAQDSQVESWLKKIGVK